MNRRTRRFNAGLQCIGILTTFMLWRDQQFALAFAVGLCFLGTQVTFYGREDDDDDDDDFDEPGFQG